MTDAHNTLQTGIDAIRRGDKDAARDAFRRVLHDDPDNVQAWLWMAGVANTREEKRRMLEQAQRLDPDNTLARKGLDTLGGPPASNTAPDTAVVQPAVPERSSASGDENAFPPRRKRRLAAASTGAASVGAANVARVERDTLVLGANDDDEDEDSRSGGWLRWGLPTLVLLAIAFGAWYFTQRDMGLPNLSGTNPAAGGETATAEPNAAVAETPEIASYPGPGVAATSEALASPVLTSTTTVNIPGVQVEGGTGTSAAPSPTPDEAVASSASGAAPSPTSNIAASPAPSAAASPAPRTSPSAASSAAASPAPRTSPSAAASAAPSVAARLVPTATPGDATQPAPSASTAARLTLLEPEQMLDAGRWQWSYYGLSNVTTGRGYSVEPSNGRYLIVLFLVQNTGDAPARIPDDLFVVTDKQGRSTTFNRQASAEYFLRYFGSNPGDYRATTEIPPTNTPVSVPLLFDVPPDATNLIVTSTADPDQGFLVRPDMR